MPRPHFTPGKTQYPWNRKLGGPQGRSGWAGNLVPTGIRSWTVQPVVSRYTDWTTQPMLHKIEVPKVVADITSWREGRWRVSPWLDNRGSPTIVKYIASRYCLLIERDPVRKNPQQILVFCAWGNLLTQSAAGTVGILSIPMTTTEHYVTGVHHTKPCLNLHWFTIHHDPNYTNNSINLVLNL